MIPEQYQRVICPYQTPSEIRSAIKFLDRLAKKIEPTVWATLIRADSPLRDWDSYGKTKGMDTREHMGMPVL